MRALRPRTGTSAVYRPCLVAAAIWASAGAAMAQVTEGPDVLSMRLGSTGLLQTPNARFAGVGEYRAGFSNVHPYRSAYMTAEPIPRVQATFRYVSIQDRVVQTETQSQSSKDKSFDAKFLLLREGTWNPAIAVGLIDFGGTGLLSSEYIVASRRVYDFDFTLGMGWGRLGARGGLRNPLTSVSDRFDNRERDDAPGGTLNTGKYFSGPRIHPFGGVQWTPGGGPLTLVVEYDGNDFSTDRTGRRRDVDSPINVGFNYRAFGKLDLSLSWERGNTVGAHIGFRTNFMQNQGPPKVMDAAPLPISPRLPEPDRAKPDLAQDAEAVDALATRMAADRFTARAVELDPDLGLARVWFSQDVYDDAAVASGRAARLSSHLLPPDYPYLEVVQLEGDVPRYRTLIPRQSLHLAGAGLITPDELTAASEILPPEANAHRRANFPGLKPYPAYTFGIAPGVRYNIGRPDGFVIGQILAVASGVLDLTSRLNLSASYGYSLVDNVDKVETDFPSNLPRVRSNTTRYLQEGNGFLRRLEANYVWALDDEWLARVSGGYTDEMFAGVGGEVLYRPFAARWAVGANINRVRQRDFNQLFSMQDYEVTTGHLSIYYEIPWENLLAHVSVGRYLAADHGTTIDLSRRFANGARIGAWATFTNVSSSDFGEGSFDKGFYIFMPFDLFLPSSNRGGANFAFRPLTRDGGQKVRDGESLYFRHNTQRIENLYNSPGHILQ
jgi:hypothetical protein